MIDFKPIELQDKNIFDSYYNINKDISSEYNFTTLFAWQEMYGNYYAIVNNCLCVKSVEGYAYPIGKKEDVKIAIKLLSEDCLLHSDRLFLISVTKRMLDEFNDFHSECEYTVKDRRDLFDYFYLREKLATLKGKKMHKKKNHYNYFIENYNFKFVDLDDTNEELCKEFFKQVIFDRSLDPEKEYFATLKVLKYRKEIGMKCKCLFVDDQLIGVIMGQIHNGTVLIQIAKSNIDYRGASVALFTLFLQNDFLDCEYVNFMEDMGIEGLRKMKQSYYPEFLCEKYSIERIICKKELNNEKNLLYV